MKSIWTLAVALILGVGVMGCTKPADKPADAPKTEEKKPADAPATPAAPEEKK